MRLELAVVGAQRCPYLPWVTACQHFTEEGQSRQTCTLISLSLETNAGSSLAAPFPLLTFLSNQPVDSSSSPASAPLLCPLVKSQEMPPEHMLVKCPVLCCALPFLPLAFSLHPQRLGRDQDILGPSPTIRITHPLPSHEGQKKKVKQKNLLYRDIFLLYKVCTGPKTKEKKV